MDGEVLERYYLESLEERIIAETASVRNIPLEAAMDLYYNSRLSKKIQQGEYDIQYLDYKVLTQYLMDELNK